jgi:hypothetical protein
VVNRQQSDAGHFAEQKQTLYTNRVYKEGDKRLEDLQWTVNFSWVKAHVEIQGNERADRLAMKAATEDIREIVYGKISRETIITELKENGLTKWQGQWTSTTEGAISKLFFPCIKERIKTTIPI